MKPSPRPSIRLILAALFALLWTQLAGAAQPAFHFNPSEYTNRTLTYLWTTTGTIEVTGDSFPGETVSLEISSPIAVTFLQPSADGMPFELVISSPRLRGVEPEAALIGPISLRGRLDQRGTLVHVETPPFLSRLGLDMTDLLLGLVVPAPEDGRSVSPGSEWQGSFVRSALVSETARRLDLKVTYTAGREVDWGNRMLQSVTARVRADAVVREGTFRTEIQEIGHGLFYLRPDTGVSELSSISVITQIETRPPSSRTATSRTKITLTTTLSLQEIRPLTTFAASESLAAAPESDGGASGPEIPAPLDESGAHDGSGTVTWDSEPGGTAETVSASSFEEETLPPAQTVPASKSGLDADPDPALGEGPPAKAGEAVEASWPAEEAGGAVEITPGAPGPAAGEALPSLAGREEPVLPGEPGAAPASTDEPAETEAPVEPEAALGEEQPLGRAAAATYKDPAGRFELDLGPEWIPEPRSLGLRVTAFASRDGNEHAYVYVMPLPSPAATALSIARSALATYGETQSGFRVVSEPELDQLDGEVAYRAEYTYLLDGRPVREWALFARMRDRAFYVQYAYVGEAEPPGLVKLQTLRDGFRFGADPKGAVPVQALSESLEPYTDPLGRFSLKVPALWPLTEESSDASSAVFTEIGENGYLTLLAETGARGIRAAEIVSAWKEQWSREPGFQILVDVSPAPLGSVDGVRFDYTWSGGNSGDWSRRLHAAVIDDLFVAIALDYAAPGFGDRQAIFDEIVRSFTPLEPAAPVESLDAPSRSGSAPVAEPQESLLADPDAGDDEPFAGEEGAFGSPASQQTPAPAERPDPEELAREYPFAEPEGDDTVILLGRILTRFPGPSGAMVEAWASGLEVTVIAGQDEFTGVTDDRGYLYVANLPRLAQGRLYTIARLDGPMLGFTEPVSVTFDNLRIGQVGPRVAHLRTLILTLHSDRSLSVELVRYAASAADEPSALVHFVTEYPRSAWASHVEEVILSGLD